jgi:ABC-2 type transport system permease protein
VRHVRTVVLDQARTQESRVLIDRFVNTADFDVIGEVFTDKDLVEWLVAGRARVGIKIPEDYSRRIQAGETAQVLILVDGSESSVAAEAVNVGNAIAMGAALDQIANGRQTPVEARPRVLFNPDTRSPNFFIPGLMVVLCQLMAVMLTSNAIVREKERGTLEQLFMTPVRSGELVLGKTAPYLVLTFLEFALIAILMRVVFRVPIHGDVVTLLVLVVPFLLTMLGWGLWISTSARTRDAAFQMAMATVMPSIFLSGYVFPIESMPKIFWLVSQVIPTTWMIDVSRGVILRGAGWNELWPDALILSGMAAFWLLLSALRFRKQLT